jgi:hypothetical protein
MKTSQHTPGPWHCNAIAGQRITGDETSKDWDRLHINGGNRTIARVYMPRDATLIKAAPDLLTALQALTTWATSLSEQSDENAQDLLELFRRNHCGAMFSAESAIAKALGNQ